MTGPDPRPADWLVRFERAGLVGRALMLGEGATRLAAGLVERAIDRAATLAVEAHDAFQKELDPNVSDARVLEDVRERPPRAPRNDG